MKILTVVGARPQFIKASALSKMVSAQSNAENGLVEILVHTGQHYDAQMSDTFFAELGIPQPAHHLHVGGGSHANQTGDMMKGLEKVMIAEAPSIVVVYGDTNSTIAAALVAAKLHLPIAHVEAGLRSFDRRMPEEVNRVVTDHLSSILFCPSGTAVENLRHEGITRNVHVVGDVMYDVFLDAMHRVDGDHSAARSLNVVPGQFALVTVHRAGNTDDSSRFDSIVAAICAIAETGLAVVWPVHPRTRDLFSGRDLPPNLVLTEPASYLRMAQLTRDANVIITDSGGLQKEAFWAHTPCVTLRDETEWVETVTAGWNTIVGTDPVRIVEAALNAPLPLHHPDLYGNGDAAARIVRELLMWNSVAS